MHFTNIIFATLPLIASTIATAAPEPAPAQPVRCGRFGSAFCCAYSDGPTCVPYPAKREAISKREPEPIRCGRFGSSFCCAYSEGPTCVPYPFRTKRDVESAEGFKTPTVEEILAQADKEDGLEKREAEPVRCGRFGSSFCCAYSEGPTCVAYPFKAKREVESAEGFKTPTIEEIIAQADAEEAELAKREAEPIRCGRFGSAFCCAYSDGPTCVPYPARRDLHEVEKRAPEPVPEPIRCGRFGSSFCCAYSEGPTCVPYPFRLKRDLATDADLEVLDKRENRPDCGVIGSVFCCTWDKRDVEGSALEKRERYCVRRYLHPDN